MNRPIFKSIAILVFVTLFACKEKNETKNTESNSETETEIETETSAVSGTVHFLDYSGIKVLLPEGYEQYSLVRYQELLESVLTKEEFKMENYRLTQLKDMEGSLYLFYNKENKSNISINATPHIPFEKENAQELLNGIALDNQNLPNLEKLSIEKVEAKFSGTKNQQVFKAVYKFTDKKTKNHWFTTNYIISANEKTLFMEITQPELINYNPYIEKIIF